MTSLVRPSFWRSYAKLDARVKRDAARIYRLFESDPTHPSLRFKKLAGASDVWSVRINGRYRAVGQKSGDDIFWFWIGSHNDFDKLFG